MQKKQIANFFYIISLPILLFPFKPVLGKLIPDPSGSKKGCPDDYKGNCGNYKLDDFVKIAVKAFDYLLGITGSLALLFFIYGGVLFLISGGNKERIEKAKKTLVNSVIGIVLVFASYMIVGFVFRALGADNAMDGTSWAKTGWFNN